jgi:hypothetical protein
MQRLGSSDLPAAGATLAAGVTGGFACGSLIGGVGGRLAMLLLRLTSDPTLRGVRTDDGFTIGRVSSETLFLLGVTAALGMAGGVFYLVVRGWIPRRGRVPAMTVFFGLVGGAGLISPHGLDFNAIEPLPLAVGLFVAIPVAYGAAMPWLTERLLREDSSLRRRRWAWVAGLAPLVLANVVGLLVLAAAWIVWTIGRASPVVLAAWRSRAAVWAGRAALVVASILGGAGVARDAFDILA